MRYLEQLVWCPGHNVLGLNAIRTSAHASPNQGWHLQSVKEEAGKSSFFGRRVLGWLMGLDHGKLRQRYESRVKWTLTLIPHPRDTLLSRVARVLAPVLRPGDPSTAQGEVLGLLAVQPSLR
ncbi:hypothetical protein M419DRAFT_120119 [Trichoderma reesei RUT C-30]|uniref:Uncharacterized protein n=1 Tax=Hypocrea jecorina (strain ATCC 56765 / BCRC 32924 / NRRL 11460 / Rut C-30) TaxID=1344414 RepID=A0A024S4X4_HYPJR|nr:hypothetical protein M419DRAFT_120119 [Trichoderma reesei RUT C-30]